MTYPVLWYMPCVCPQDQKNNQMYLGVTHQGIMTFHGSRRTQMYKWWDTPSPGAQKYIYTQIAHPTMNSFAPKGVHYPINSVLSEYIYLSCNNVCEWSCLFNSAKHNGCQQQQWRYNNFRFAICWVYIP